MTDAFYTAVVSECTRLTELIKQINQRISEIEEAGYTSAKLIKRGNGYKGKQNYYLSHSVHSDWVKAGGPRLEYVGTKPEKVAAAQARIDRYQELQKLQSERVHARHKLEAVKYHFRQVQVVLFSGDGNISLHSDILRVTANG